jgi:hypothetical protein
MRRTITMEGAEAYYGGKKIGYIKQTIRNHFKLKSRRIFKYVITIVEGTKYSFFDNDYSDSSYGINKYPRYSPVWKVGSVCKAKFEKLFFVPDFEKRYDITIERI